MVARRQQADAQALAPPARGAARLQVRRVVCTECGKPCRSDTEVALHTQRTGHASFEDKVRQGGGGGWPSLCRRLLAGRPALMAPGASGMSARVCARAD